jgi:hypothetical protein
MQSLETHGVEGGKVSLLGPGAEEARAETDTADRDSRMSGDVGKRAAVAAAAGGAVGGTAGFLAGAAAFSIPGIGPVIGAGVWAAAIGGAVAGAGVGGVVGGISSLEMGEAGDLTHESLKAGRVVVVVHIEDEEEASSVEKVLIEKDPLEVHRFDRGAVASGRPEPAVLGTEPTEASHRRGYNEDHAGHSRALPPGRRIRRDAGPGDAHRRSRRQA